ncbi:MAG: hypothetical protein ACRDT4_03405 [Micromonosporaceae bacterium]
MTRTTTSGGRRLLGPTWVVAVLTVLSGIGVAAGPLSAGGWLLTWLLLGLTAGYALSGSP